MLDKILRLGKETAIYGLSTVVGRLLNFLIVPFYANVLLPAENGVISNIYAYIAFAYVIFCYGMEPAYMRFVSSLELGDKKQNFSVPFLSLLATSVLLALAIHFNSPALASFLGVDSSQHYFIQYAGWILCLDALTIIPFASLRMEQKAKRFAALKIFNITANLLLNLGLILGLGMHAEGVFLANLLASGLTFLAMIGMVLRRLTFKFPVGLYKEILQFGLPYIPAGLAGIAMQVIDRPIVKALTNDATLGIYQLNYRLGIFMMLIVGMFDYAWRPFFLNHAKDADAKPLFAKVFTYFVLGAMSVFLTISLFIEDIVRMKFFGKQFFPPIYWQGVEIVPWVLLAYVFTGAYVVFVVGVYLEKKTKYLPFITGAGALLNVGANLFLIPKIGILGAALSTLFSYIVMATGMYFASQRFYRVEYEWNKVLTIAGSAACMFILYRVLHLQPLDPMSIVVKLVLVIAFGAALVLLKVIDAREMSEMKSIVQKVLTRSSSSKSSEELP
ncbi:MAG: polysaccharide biosynthesis C-terminal domain-containing protein [Ignavibacteriales bacterium]|nr:polysaccharide biosynthesis C-terminal domain-containing protein [Ignavibacteriales bacterium]